MATAITPTPENTSWGLVSVAAPPITGAQQDPEQRRAQRGADRLAAAVGGGHAHQPRQRARPGAGAANALDEAGGVQHHDRLAVPERDAGHGDQRQPGDRGGLRADPPGQPAGGQGGQQCAGGIGGVSSPAEVLESPRLSW